MESKSLSTQLSPCVYVLSVVVEEDLEPARAGSDELAGVTRAPAFREADAHTVRVIRSV